METAVTTENRNEACAQCNCGSVVGLASAVTFAAAGSLLGYSLLARNRRIPVPVQVLLGLVAGGAGVMTWRKRQEELAAAREFMDHVHDVRDKRWLKKHPVAYG
jgi:hypothetical protein